MDAASHGELVAVFRERYGTAPHAVARAPGRVNLVGEHIDYEGFGVLPMAINQACYIAIGWRTQQQQSNTTSNTSLTPSLGGSHTQESHRMMISNMQQTAYPPGEFVLDPAAALPASCPRWIKYVHAAYKGATEFCVAEGHRIPNDSDIQMMVHSDIPPGAGLSSSSALVVSSALALLTLWGVSASQQQLADFTCRCERYVGTQGGGMDQAVSVMAQPGLALHVEFNPVRSSPVRLPPGGVLVVANSLTPSLKAETAANRFNLRVLECRLAAMMLANNTAQLAEDAGDSSTHDKSPALDWHDVKVLKQVEPMLLHVIPDTPVADQQEQQHMRITRRLRQAVLRLLPESSYTLTQVCQFLGCSEAELLSLLPPPLQEAAAAADKLYLQQRALHVFSESQSVLQFKAVCCDNTLSVGDKLGQLGVLMDASHSSCAGLYQCSCDELDTLVKVAKQAGALGARLTGAGWGGCIVALIHGKQADALMETLQQQYYTSRCSQHSNIKQYLFTTLPSAGAWVGLTGL